LWGEPAFFAGITLGEVEIFLKQETPGPKILLHTNEGAEPHMKSQLKHIEELKKKHGID
jgi:hypothetical protein